MGRHFRYTITHKKQTGFTIIETMLVLAITGLLITGLLVGLGSSIGVQRYKDAVSSLKSEVQAQYSQVANVTNTQDGSWECGAAAAPSQSGAGITRGQSDCVVLGRYLSIEDTRMTAATVVGYKLSGAPGANDIATLKSNYRLGIAGDTVSRSTLEWGAQIAWPASGDGAKKPTTPRSVAILIVRSPDSGTVYTFASNRVVEAGAISASVLGDMLIANTSATPGRAAQYICIDPNGVNVPEKFALYVAKAANGPSSIEVRSDAVNASLGGTSKCSA